MTVRPSILISACVVVLVLALWPLLWPFLGHVRDATPPPVASPPHGSFSKRLQPKLDGIGSTKNLPPVELDTSMSHAAPSAAPSSGATRQRDERAHRAR